MSKQRTCIAEAQKNVLEAMFNEGMDSKGKQCREKHLEAALKTGLPVNVIVEWIGNRNKKANGRSYQYAKPVYSKGMSAYNMFVHENKARFSDIKQWSTAWSELPAEEKKRFKTKASKEGTEIKCTHKARKILEKRLHNTVINLHKIGISVSCLGVDADGNQVFVGSGIAQQFFQERPHIHNELLLYSKTTGETTTVCTQKHTKDLRKDVAIHLNNLYAKEVGKSVAFPYKKVMEGKILISGLPDEILPLRVLSHYGEHKLKAILSCKEIKITASSICDDDKNSSTEAELLTLVSLEDVINADVSGQPEAAAVTLDPDDIQEIETEELPNQSPSKFEQGEYKVKSLLRHRKQGRNVSYLVQWEDSWVAEGDYNKSDFICILDNKTREGKNYCLMRWTPSWQSKDDIVDKNLIRRYRKSLKLNTL